MSEISRLCKIQGAGLDGLNPKLRKLLRNPQYICRKCLRVSKKKKMLCKPEKL
jgi:hypothetical protein